MNKITNKGLTNKEVLERRKRYGTNEIVLTKKNSFIHELILSLGDPIIKILLIALGIKVIFLLKDFDWYETIGIVIAIFIASFISTISEYGSEQAFLKLQEQSSKIKCKVRRNGKIELIDINDLVVGDLLFLAAGDRVGADAKILEGNLLVDESSLNGETKEVLKDINNPYLYRGTVIYSEQAIAKVIKVGKDTFYGKLSEELQEKSPDGPLKIRLTKLAKTISMIGYIGALLVTISYLFKMIIIDNNFDITLIKNTITNIPVITNYILSALALSVTIIVVAVPEGLPMMITLVLSSNMKRMLKSNVLVRKLQGIETAGNINILFTDKTGTLTKGNLKVDKFVDSDLRVYKNKEELKKHPLYEQIKQSFIYNNSSIYSNNEIIGGNVTDKALLEFFSEENTILKKTNIKPFNSINKYSSCQIENKELIKGAHEVLFPKCLFYYTSNKQKKILSNKQKFINQINNYTNLGYRVLTIAVNDHPNTKGSLILLGFILIKDELRETSMDALKELEKAHVQTIMITGDNKETAIKVGRESGLIIKPNDLVLTSNEINNLSDEEIKMQLSSIKIIARALPQDKSRLVRLSQELKLVVGMTGDGVNDSPALKKADVGFSMGSGSEVAKEASDIVILDNNLLSISKAVLYGRTIFISIRKFIIFQLTVNLCAISLSIIGPFIGVATPVTVIQMLWINMVMDTLAALAFSYEQPLEEYMEEYPEKKDNHIINKYMLNEILITGIYSSILCILFLKLQIIKENFRYDINNKYLLTGFFGLFIFIGIFNAFNARTTRINILSNILKNKAFIIIILFIIVVQLILIYYGGNLFRTAGLTIREFKLMLIIALTVIPFDIFRKIINKKKN